MESIFYVFIYLCIYLFIYLFNLFNFTYVFVVKCIIVKRKVEWYKVPPCEVRYPATTKSL